MVGKGRECLRDMPGVSEMRQPPVPTAAPVSVWFDLLVAGDLLVSGVVAL